MHAFAQAFAPWALPGVILVSTVGALVMCLLVFRYGFPSAASHARELSGNAVLVIRFGHAIAGACFAIAALLAVVVIARPARSSAPPDAAALPAAALPAVAVRGEMDALRRELVDAQAALARRLADAQAELARAESRLGAADTEADAERMRVEDLEARVRAAETALQRVSEEASRAMAATRQLAAASAPSSQRAAAARPKPSLTPTEPTRPAPDAAIASRPAEPDPETSPGASRPAATPPRPSTAEAEADPDPDLGTRLREDWQLVKRESRQAGEQVRDAFRRLREALR